MKHSKQRKHGKYKQRAAILIPQGINTAFCYEVRSDLHGEHLNNGDCIFFSESKEVKNGSINAILKNGKLELMRIYVNGGGNDAICIRLEAGSGEMPKLLNLDTLNICGYATHILKRID